jgi:hypothetical protein
VNRFGWPEAALSVAERAAAAELVTEGADVVAEHGGAARATDRERVTQSGAGAAETSVFRQGRRFARCGRRADARSSDARPNTSRTARPSGTSRFRADAPTVKMPYGGHLVRRKADGHVGAVNNDGAAAFVSVHALVAAVVITTSPGFGVPLVAFDPSVP